MSSVRDTVESSCTADACLPAGEQQPSSSSPGRSYKISGLDCAEEISALKRAVGPVVDGDTNLAFDVLNARMTVSAAARQVPEERILSAVSSTGMKAVPWTESSGKHPDGQRREQLLFTMASGAFVLAGIAIHTLLAGGLENAWRLFVSHAGQTMPAAEIGAYVLAIAAGSRFVIIKAWYAARRLRPDMNFLMTIAVIGAAIIGEWFEAATVSFLFSLSLTLESWSVARARRAIAALLELAPQTARRLRSDGTEDEAPVAAIRPGERLLVLAGERIPLDGRVVEGHSAVNQAPVTGESVPVEKETGSEVFAGTINGDGTLTIEASKAAKDSTLARIIRMVEEAHGRRAPSEQWVERFARVYTPLVMALALLVFVVPPLALGGDWGEYFYRALVLLVIACPCALVISTPFPLWHRWRPPRALASW